MGLLPSKPSHNKIILLEDMDSLTQLRPYMLWACLGSNSTIQQIEQLPQNARGKEEVVWWQILVTDKQRIIIGISIICLQSSYLKLLRTNQQHETNILLR